MAVEITVDRKAIPLNAFTQEIIGNVAKAMTESLHGIDPGYKEITIKFQKD
jgi:hypothetical protein